MLYPNTDLLSFPSSVCVCVCCFRVIYLQVSMNDGLSFISSNVHITTTECVSGSFMYPCRDTAKILIVQKIERKNVCVVCTLLLLLLLLSPTFLSFLSCLTFSTLRFVFLLFFLVAKPQRLVAVSHPTKTL